MVRDSVHLIGPRYPHQLTMIKQSACVFTLQIPSLCICIMMPDKDISCNVCVVTS